MNGGSMDMHQIRGQPWSCRVQSLFSSLGDDVKGQTIALGGDGRYFNKDAAQIICKIAAGNGLKKVPGNHCHC